MLPVASTRWGGMGASPATSATSNGLLNLAPIRFVKSGSIDRIATEVTVVGDAGSLVTPAWYNDNNGLPGSPLLSIGNMPGDALGVTQFTVAIPIIAGLTYWVGGVTTLAPTVQPTVRTMTASVVSAGLGSANSILGNTCTGMRQNGVTLPLPDPFVFADFAFQILRLVWRFA